MSCLGNWVSTADGSEGMSRLPAFALRGERRCENRCFGARSQRPECVFPSYQAPNSSRSSRQVAIRPSTCDDASASRFHKVSSRSQGAWPFRPGPGQVSGQTERGAAHEVREREHSGVRRRQVAGALLLQKRGQVEGGPTQLRGHLEEGSEEEGGRDQGGARADGAGRRL